MSCYRCSWNYKERSRTDWLQLDLVTLPFKCLSLINGTSWPPSRRLRPKAIDQSPLAILTAKKKAISFYTMRIIGAVQPCWILGHQILRPVNPYKNELQIFCRATLIIERDQWWKGKLISWSGGWLNTQSKPWQVNTLGLGKQLEGSQFVVIHRSGSTLTDGSYCRRLLIASCTMIHAWRFSIENSTRRCDSRENETNRCCWRKVRIM